jgi:hypothetical protein
MTRDQGSFFVRDGEHLRATVLTRGPWNDEHQHGGPPAALLTGAIERADPDPSAFRLARVMVEFLRPVPIAGLLEISWTARRAGRQAQRIDAALVADGVEVARAIGLRLRTAALGASARSSATVLPPPDSAGSFRVPFFRTEPAYHTAMDIRIVEGQWGRVPVGAWGRARVPLVLGEETSAVERTMIFADAESGIGPPLDPSQYAFVNPDLTVYFARAPVGEWTGLRVAAQASEDGIGLAESDLFDGKGSFGRAAQSLFIRPRPRGTMPPPPPSAPASLP